MKISAFPKYEPSSECWFWRLLLGPAAILDGVFETLTFGFYGIGVKLTVAKNLAKARIKLARPATSKMV